jgi:putative nucleotidyltransferase with HDIG domain
MRPSVERRARSSTPKLRLVGDVTDRVSYAALVARGRQAERRGASPEARALYEVALHRLAEAADSAEASNLLRWIARTHLDGSDLDLTLDCAEAALAVAEAHGHLGALGHAASLLAAIRLQQGDLDEAERLYRRARIGAVQAGESRFAAVTSQNLGIVASIRGDHCAAVGHYTASLETYRELHLQHDVCVVLNHLALLHTRSGRWDDAECAYDEAMIVAVRLCDCAAQMLIEVHRAELHVARGDFVAARAAAGRAMCAHRLADDAPCLGEAHKVYGVVERECGDFGNAARHLDRAYEIATTRGDVLLLADTTKELADLHGRQGHNREALVCLNRARCLFAQLHARQELAEVGRRTGRLESDFLDVARQWGRSIECNDEYTQGHCERVADIACALASADGMDGQSLFWFRIGALLHDVGKLVLSREVLNKRGTLSAEEWTLVRGHPAAGVEMLAAVEFPWDVRPIVESHHERWDGAGYPHGLAGDAIPRVARMVCIADVYDALTSERSYKRAMSHDAALVVMRGLVGRQFDPGLFASFELVAERHRERWTRQARGVRRVYLTLAARHSDASLDSILAADDRSALSIDACRFRITDDDVTDRPAGSGERGDAELRKGWRRRSNSVVSH